MTLEPIALDHLVLRVHDLKAMAAFYCDVLGCSVDRWREELGLVHLRVGRDSMIDLADAEILKKRRGAEGPAVEGTQRFYPNVEHFALTLAQFDADAIRAHLLAHGITAAPTLQRYGALGDRISMYFTDPEGNMVELRAAQP